MVGGTLLVGGGVLLGIYRFGFEAVNDLRATLSPYLHGLRAGVLAGVVIFWPRLIDRLADWLLMGPAMHRALLAWRWRALLWILLIELVVIHEVPLRFLRTLGGGDS